MKNTNFKKLISLIVLSLFIIFMFNFIVKTFDYLLTAEELTEQFNILIASDSAIGNATNFAFNSFFGGVSSNISVYGSLVFGMFFYFLFVFGIPALLLWVILRVMYLITTWGRKFNV